MSSPKGTSTQETGFDEPRKTMRLNADMSEVAYRSMQRALEPYGVSMADAARYGLGIIAAAVPILARGGDLVIRDPDGSDRIFMLPLVSTAAVQRAPTRPETHAST